MKKSLIIPILFSLVLLGTSLYAQSNAVPQNDSLVLLSKKMTLPKAKNTIKKQSEPEVFMEFTMDDIAEVSPYKIVVYDVQGNEVLTLSSESEVTFDKVPKNANLLMKEGKTTFYILDKEGKIEAKQ